MYVYTCEAAAHKMPLKQLAAMAGEKPGGADAGPDMLPALGFIIPGHTSLSLSLYLIYKLSSWV